MPAPDLWGQNAFVIHRVRNMLRRGWLLKTYNDEKLLKGRVKTGEQNENDDLDILHPAGYVAHVAPGDKTEVFTMDVNGDPSRRVIMAIIGDREHHPQPDENEAFFHAPGDKEMFTRHKKERTAQQRANSNSGRTKESGRESGIHADGKTSNMSGTTKGAQSTNAEKGIGTTTQGNVTTRAGGNVQTHGGKLIDIGESHRQGTQYIEGILHAGDVFAGGGTSIAASHVAADVGGKEYGLQTWAAQGRNGMASLLQTAASLGLLTGLFNMFQSSQQQQNEQQQNQNQQTNQDLDDLKQRVAVIEQILREHGWMT